MRLFTVCSVGYRLMESCYIISVEVEDAGRFTCEALNPAGKISKDFVIIVQGLW